LLDPARVLNLLLWRLATVGGVGLRLGCEPLGLRE
jgi:hypothetical protein